MRVRVYRNLHKNTFSIMSKETGRVIAHEDHVSLGNAKFIVQQAGWKKVHEGGAKNVHAFVEGEWEAREIVWMAHLEMPIKISYNPRVIDRGPYFYASNELPVLRAEFVKLSIEEGVKALYVDYKYQTPIAM